MANFIFSNECLAELSAKPELPDSVDFDEIRFKPNDQCQLIVEFYNKGIKIVTCPPVPMSQHTETVMSGISGKLPIISF